MLRCADGSLYTGITTDVNRRLQEHGNADGAGRGAKYVRGKQPLKLVYQIQAANRSEASKLEYRVKRLSKSDKEAVVRKTVLLSDLITDVRDI